MARIISQAVDESGNVHLLKDDGILEKRTSANALLWSVQTKQEPTTGNFVFANQIALDLDNNVWLTYSDALSTVVRSASSGALVTEVLGTAADVIVAQAGGDLMFAVSSSRGILYEMDRVTKTLARSSDLTVKVPGYTKGVFLAQMGSSPSEDLYFGALLAPAGQAKTAELVRFDPSLDGTFTCHSIGGEAPVVAVSSDAQGLVYAATVEGGLIRFNEALGVFDAVYAPSAPGGVINTITFTEANEIVLTDDGTFSFAGSKTRIVKPSDGTVLSSVSSSNVGTTSGDPLGYHHIKLTRINLPLPPIVPAVDSNKVDVYVKSDGTVSAVGRPGAVADTDTVEFELDAGPTLIGSVVPNADGSFSIASAPGAGNPAGEPTTIRAIKGAQTTTLAANSEPRNLPVGFDVAFQTSGLVQTGAAVRLKAAVTLSGSPVTPSPGVFPIFRIKEDASGKWFNGQGFVSDNGDYLAGTYDADGGFWFVDVAFPATVAGSLSLIIKDSPPFATGLVLVGSLASQATLLDVQQVVEELNDRVDIAFGAPATSLGNVTTVGGFLAERLNEIQKNTRRLLAGIVGSRNVVVESITVDVSTQSVPKGSTPAIDITIFDAERRFPLDISGARVFFKAKANLASPVLVIDREGSIVDGSTGQARVKLLATDTATVQRVTGQVVADIPGTGILVSPAFFFDITESVL